MFQSEWINAAEFRARLQIGRTTQWRLMKSGFLRLGIHFIRTGIGKRSALKFNYPACELALAIYTQA